MGIVWWLDPKLMFYKRITGYSTIDLWDTSFPTRLKSAGMIYK